MPIPILRRHCIAATLLLCSSGLWAQPQVPPPAEGQARILVLGDSLSAEYGLKRGEGWVSLLSNRLAQEKMPYQVINASISGETSAGGRSRISALLAQHRPAVVVIELGANDALRGLPLAMTQDNLTYMVRSAHDSGARVLLIGIQVPPNYGPRYNQDLAVMFATVARTGFSALVPFLLKGVADAPDASHLFQADQIHPVAAAHPTLLANVWPALKKLLHR